jgi:hypothetical protein
MSKRLKMRLKGWLHGWSHYSHVLLWCYSPDRKLVGVACCGNMWNESCDFHCGSATYNPTTGAAYTSLTSNGGDL